MWFSTITIFMLKNSWKRGVRSVNFLTFLKSTLLSPQFHFSLTTTTVQCLWQWQKWNSNKMCCVQGLEGKDLERAIMASIRSNQFSEIRLIVVSWNSIWNFLILASPSHSSLGSSEFSFVLRFIALTVINKPIFYDFMVSISNSFQFYVEPAIWPRYLP